jgi:hypothetical protein
VARSVLAHITDGAFDAAFFPSSGDVTGARDDSVVAGEDQKAWIEPHQVALMFGDRSCQIIEPKLTRAAMECLESMNVAADECTMHDYNGVYLGANRGIMTG